MRLPTLHHSGHRSLDRRRDGFDVRDELVVQSHVEAARSGCGSGVVKSLDHRAQDCESGALDVGRLGADERRHGLDGGLDPPVPS